MTVNREKLDKLGRFLLRNDWTGGLSAGVAWLVFLQVPARCRQVKQWAELVRHGLLDGALLSSFCLERRLLSAQLPHWEGLSAPPPVKPCEPYASSCISPKQCRICMKTSSDKRFRGCGLAGSCYNLLHTEHSGVLSAGSMDAGLAQQVFIGALQAIGASARTCRVGACPAPIPVAQFIPLNP